MRNWISIAEGEGIFKNNDKQTTTTRISQTDVRSTVAWLEHLTGLDLSTRLVGSGLDDPTSDDLDFLVHGLIKPSELRQLLADWCNSHKLDAREHIQAGPKALHFRAPINGRPAAGWVKVDFILTPRDPELAESTDLYTPVDDTHFLARLRDRIVNKGMVPIFEADDIIQGGHAKGIEHFEDLVFRQGSAGVKTALGFLDALANNAPGCTSAKIDGRTAILFGRNEDGEFVLTDVSGFGAVSYDGLFKHPRALIRHLAARDQRAAAQGLAADRLQNLAPIYLHLWPMLEASLPKNFRGYVQGDLLFTSTPPEEQGNLVFTPNTVTYRIPAQSKLGEDISANHMAVAVHTVCDGPGLPKLPLEKIRFNPVEGLLLVPPIRPGSNIEPTDPSNHRAIKGLLSLNGRHIDQLFNPSELRAMKISDLPRLCVDYINHLVGDSTIDQFEAQNMIPGFMNWLQTKSTPRKFVNIREYLQSPTSNADALTAAFAAFIMLHDIKMDLLQQLDRQVPGQEGWVVATPDGTVKFVDRFGFTRANKLKNSP